MFGMFGNKNAEGETSQYSPEIATLHIVTAWGDEASDPLVLNQINN